MPPSSYALTCVALKPRAHHLGDVGHAGEVKHEQSQLGLAGDGALRLAEDSGQAVLEVEGLGKSNINI